MFDFQFDETALISELGIEAAELSYQRHVLDRIHQLLNERVGIRIESALSDEELEHFDSLTDEATAKAYLAELFPNIADAYNEELAVIVDQLKTGLASVS